MTIKEISIEEVNRSVREMTEATSRAARDINASIADVNKAMQASQETSRQAAARAEEILLTARNTAEEMLRTVREAVDSAKTEAGKAADTVRSTCQYTAGQAEEKSRTTREWAEATVKSSQETIGDAVNNAAKALEVAEKISRQMVSRAEEFNNMTKQVAEESCKAARDAAELATRQANSAEEITQGALQQAADRAEAISYLIRNLAEQAARTAMETSECVKKAFEQSMSANVNRPEPGAGQTEISAIEEIFSKPSAETENVRNAAPVDKNQKLPLAAESIGPDELPDEAELPDSNHSARGSLISMLGSSLKNSIGKNREAEKKQKAEAEQIIAIERELSTEEQAKPALVDNIYDELTQYSARPVEIEPDAPVVKEIKPDSKPAKVINQDLFEGTVLIIAPSRGTTQLKDFEQQLKKLNDIKVLVTGASDKGNSKIIISLEKPQPLIQILSDLPIVKDVTRQGREVHVTL